MEIDGRQPTCERLSKRRVRIRVERSRHDMDWVPTPETLGGGSSIGIQTLTMLYQLMELPPQSLAKRIGALDATDSDLDRFRSLCRHYVDTNGALLQAARLTGEFDLVVATDLETLPAAIALGHEHNAQVLFDAHEYWPYAYPSFRHWEVQFWGGVERNLAKSADIRVTVSPNLAELMSSEYDCEFLTVPNFVPLGAEEDEVDFENMLRGRAEREQVVFLVQGNFAAYRGYEELVAAWSGVTSELDCCFAVRIIPTSRRSSTSRAH